MGFFANAVERLGTQAATGGQPAQAQQGGLRGLVNRVADQRRAVQGTPQQGGIAGLVNQVNAQRPMAQTSSMEAPMETVAPVATATPAAGVTSDGSNIAVAPGRTLPPLSPGLAQGFEDANNYLYTDQGRGIAPAGSFDMSAFQPMFGKRYAPSRQFQSTPQAPQVGSAFMGDYNNPSPQAPVAPVVQPQPQPEPPSLIRSFLNNTGNLTFSGQTGQNTPVLNQAFGLLRRRGQIAPQQQQPQQVGQMGGILRSLGVFGGKGGQYTTIKGYGRGS